jgi:hypothetical protein
LLPPSPHRLSSPPPRAVELPDTSRRAAARLGSVEAVSATRYRYELRRRSEITVTGHLSLEAPLQVGDEIAIGSTVGRVVDVEATLARGELRLLIELPTSA